MRSIALPRRRTPPARAPEDPNATPARSPERRHGPAAADPDRSEVEAPTLSTGSATPSTGARTASGRHMVEPPFRVLLVCTANRCRTPIVEHLMRRSEILTGAGWAVVSAGVKGRGGMPMHPLAAEVLGEVGFETSEWHTRALTPVLVGAADLVLAADRLTRRDIVTLVPESLNRTFVLGQFARLAASLSPLAAGTPRQRGQSLIAQVQQARSTVPGVYDDDLPDPIGHRIRHFRATVRTVDAEIVRIETPYRS